jgi:hypothetical protein
MLVAAACELVEAVNDMDRADQEADIEALALAAEFEASYVSEGIGRVSIRGEQDGPALSDATGAAFKVLPATVLTRFDAATTADVEQALIDLAKSKGWTQPTTGNPVDSALVYVEDTYWKNAILTDSKYTRSERFSDLEGLHTALGYYRKIIKGLEDEERALQAKWVAEAAEVRDKNNAIKATAAANHARAMNAWPLLVATAGCLVAESVAGSVRIVPASDQANARARAFSAQVNGAADKSLKAVSLAEWVAVIARIV